MGKRLFLVVCVGAVRIDFDNPRPCGSIEIRKATVSEPSFAPDKFILYYLCTIQGGIFQPSDEVSEAGFFSMDKLPDVRPRDVDVLKQIFEMMEFQQHELA